jgi:molybdopterin converting factor small subunit
VAAVDEHGIAVGSLDENRGLRGEDSDLMGEQSEGGQHLGRGLKGVGEKEQRCHDSNSPLAGESRRGPQRIRRGPFAIDTIPDMPDATDRPATSVSHDSVPQIRIRYWAAAKAAAGVSDEVVEARTVADAVEIARARHADEPRFDKVLSVCSFLLDESPIGARELGDVAVGDGAVLDVLPPFAGG